VEHGSNLVAGGRDCQRPAGDLPALPHSVLRVTQAVFPGSFMDSRDNSPYYFHGYSIKMNPWDGL